MISRPVLVGYDGSPGARAALAWALGEGARTGRAVHLLTAVEEGSGETTGWRRHAGEAEHREAGELLAAAVAAAARTHPEVTVRTEVVGGRAAAGLRERSGTAAVVVLGSRGRGGFADLLSGSTAVAVSAHARCPVVVVRGHGVGARRRPGHIVAGVDDSAGAPLALDFAAAQATRRRVPLHVVRAWTPPAPKYRPLDFDPAETEAAEWAALAELVADCRLKHPDVEVTTEVVADRPARTLVRASRNAQLVVVGSRGRGGFRGLLLGSVGHQLLHHSLCPVAIVRELSTD